MLDDVIDVVAKISGRGSLKSLIRQELVIDMLCILSWPRLLLYETISTCVKPDYLFPDWFRKLHLPANHKCLTEMQPLLTERWTRENSEGGNRGGQFLGFISSCILSFLFSTRSLYIPEITSKKWCSYDWRDESDSQTDRQWSEVCSVLTESSGFQVRSLGDRVSKQTVSGHGVTNHPCHHRTYAARGQKRRWMKGSQTDRQAVRQTGRHIDRLSERLTGSQTDWTVDMQVDR